MKCEYCDNDFPANVTRCPSCGATVSSGVVMPAGNQCVPQEQVQSPRAYQGCQQPVEAKSRLAYVLLGLIFGSLGIHNFYAGRSGRAVGQLLTTLLVGWMIFPVFIVWVWCLIDVCVITTDGNGVKFK